MSYQCDICHKKSMRGNLVSHSKQRTHRLYRPNLHVAKTLIDGVRTSLRLCTNCLRTLKKNGSIKTFKPVILKPEIKAEAVKQEAVKAVTAPKETPVKETAVKDVKVKTMTIEELMKGTKSEKPEEKKPKKKTAKSK